MTYFLIHLHFLLCLSDAEILHFKTLFDVYADIVVHDSLPMSDNM